MNEETHVETTLTASQLHAIADAIADAEARGTVGERPTRAHPRMTVADAYAVQGEWRARQAAAGRRPAGRKIGLTSKAMQQAVGIDEPDYGTVFGDQIWESGTVVDHARFSNPRIEVELAFVLRSPVEGPDATAVDVLRAAEYVVPALEILSSRVEMDGRSIVDTISDNAALGAVVTGGRAVDPADIDLRWAAAMLFRNEGIEETGVAGGVLGDPARGVAWLANRLAVHGERLEAGEFVLAGSFTRPVAAVPGDTFFADYGPLGVVTCRFS